MKHSQTDPEVRKEIHESINTRWSQLYELEKELGLSALQYLFLTNAGGAAATLAFIGSVKPENVSLSTKIALGSFVLGIVSVGISRAKQFHHVSGMFVRWQSLVREYHQDKKTWDEINKEDDSHTGIKFWDLLFPYLSFLSFLAGCGAGLTALL